MAISEVNSKVPAAVNYPSVAPPINTAKSEKQARADVFVNCAIGVMGAGLLTGIGYAVKTRILPALNMWSNAGDHFRERCDKAGVPNLSLFDRYYLLRTMGKLMSYYAGDLTTNPFKTNLDGFVDEGCNKLLGMRKAAMAVQSKTASASASSTRSRSSSAWAPSPLVQNIFKTGVEVLLVLGAFASGAELVRANSFTSSQQNLMDDASNNFHSL